MIALDGAMDIGLVSVSATAPPKLTLRKLDVEFLSWKKVPP